MNGTSTQITFSGGSILNGGTCTVTFTVLTANNAATGNRNNDLPVGTVTGARLPAAAHRYPTGC